MLSSTDTDSDAGSQTLPKRTIHFSRILQHNHESHVALVVLNRSLDRQARRLLERVWCISRWRICADGGANRLYDCFKDDRDMLHRFVPNSITGDLDSLRKDVASFYTLHGSKVYKVKEQNSTDFDKSLTALRDIEDIEGESKYDVLVFGGLCGRLDQTFSVLHTLQSIAVAEPWRRVFLYGDENLCTVLPAGCHNEIITCRTNEGPLCGIIPLGGPARVRTTGLKWELDGSILVMGRFISTSNQILGKDSDDRAVVRSDSESGDESSIASTNGDLLVGRALSSEPFLGNGNGMINGRCAGSPVVTEKLNNQVKTMSLFTQAVVQESVPASAAVNHGNRLHSPPTTPTQVASQPRRDIFAASPRGVRIPSHHKRRSPDIAITPFSRSEGSIIIEAPMMKRNAESPQFDHQVLIERRRRISGASFSALLSPNGSDCLGDPFGPLSASAWSPHRQTMPLSSSDSELTVLIENDAPVLWTCEFNAESLPDIVSRQSP